MPCGSPLAAAARLRASAARSWEHDPAISSTPRLRSTRRSLCSMRASRAFSKSISPVANTICDSFRRMCCLGVGSNVSGLAPEGTSTSMAKSSPVISWTRYFRGRIVTVTSGLLSPAAVRPEHETVNSAATASSDGRYRENIIVGKRKIGLGPLRPYRANIRYFAENTGADLRKTGCNPRIGECFDRTYHPTHYLCQ